jgi:hypothetical protein
VLTLRLKDIAETHSSGFPEVPTELAKPLPAGLALQDPRRFPALNEFRSNFKYGGFRTAYLVAKPIMQEKAGLPVEQVDAMEGPPVREG